MPRAYRPPGLTARIARQQLAAGIARTTKPPAQLALPARGGLPRPVSAVLAPLVYEEPIADLRPGECATPRDPVSGAYLRDREGHYLDPHDWRHVRPGWLQCRRCGQWTPTTAEVRP